MNDKSILWIVTVVAALAAGAVSLYGTVKQAAARLLDREGAFNDIRREGDTAVRHIDENRPTASDRITAIAEVNKTYWTKRKNILHQRGADSFSGAWTILPARIRNQCLGFAAIFSVATGAITYGIGHVMKKSGWGGGSFDSDSDVFSPLLWLGGDGHHGGGHDGGGHWGGGFDGGFDGGFGGGH